MAGKKGRSGPPLGNLNAAKSVLPALARLRREKSLPPGMGRVLALANREAEQLVTDKGSWGNMSGVPRLAGNEQGKMLMVSWFFMSISVKVD